MQKSIRVFALALALVGGSAVAATAQQEKMKECNARAAEKSLKGDERKAFMKDCLSAKKEPAPGAKAARQEKMKSCRASAGEQGLKGAERKKFMSECLQG